VAVFVFSREIVIGVGSNHNADPIAKPFLFKDIVMEKISGTKEWAVAAMEKQRDRNIRPSATPRENPRHRTTEHNPHRHRLGESDEGLAFRRSSVAVCPRRNPAKFGQGAAGRYGLMSAEELIGLGPLVKSIIEQEDDAALFMWAVWPRLPLALQVIEAWGFRYTTAAFVWTKTTNSGGFHRRCGYYTASNTEPFCWASEVACVLT